MTARFDRSSILQGIEEVARKHLDLDRSIGEDDKLVKALRLDSLRLLVLVVEIENRFRICLDEGSEASIETAGQLADIIAEKLEGGDADPE